MVLLAALVGITMVVAGRGGVRQVAQGNNDEAQIRRVLQRFAAAIDRNDRNGITALLCTEEAEQFTEGLGDAEDPGPDESPASSLEIFDVRVTGGVAAVRVARPPTPPVMVYLRKEEGAWKLCAPAGVESFPDVSASPSATPPR